MKYHLTPVRMAIIKSTNEECWRRVGKGASCTVAGMQTGAAIVESSTGFLRKLTRQRPYGPAVPLLGMCPEKTPDQGARGHKAECEVAPFHQVFVFELDWFITYLKQSYFGCDCEN